MLDKIEPTMFEAVREALRRRIRLAPARRISLPWRRNWSGHRPPAKPRPQARLFRQPSGRRSDRP